MQAFTIEQTDLQCVVTWRYYSKIVVYAIICCLVTFPIGNLLFVAVHEMFGEHKLFLFLLLLPFWIFWFVGLVIVAHILFGKTRLVLGEDGLKTTYTCLWFERNEQIELDEIRLFVSLFQRRSFRLTTGCLRVVCQNREVDFSPPETKIDDLCIQLNIVLRTLQAETAGIPDIWELPAPIVFGLNTPPRHIKSPPKNRWYYQVEFAGFSFKTCNSLEFFRTTTWTFAHGEATFRTVHFGFTRTANYNLTDWNSLVVRLPEDEKVKPELIVEGNYVTVREFYDGRDIWQVVLLDKNEASIATIEGLYKPEALWMVDVLLQEQRAITAFAP